MSCLCEFHGSKRSFDGSFCLIKNGVTEDCYCDLCHRRRQHGLLAAIWGEIHNLGHASGAATAIERTLQAELRPMARK